MAFVCDASALVFAVTERARAAARFRERLRSETVHAPHLIDAEFGNVLRRKVLRGELEEDQAAVHLASAPSLVDRRYDHLGALAAAAWVLRDNVTFYDALYVALAAALDVPLVTLDEHLRSVRNLPCTVEVLRLR